MSAAAEDDFGPRVSGAYAADGPTLLKAAVTTYPKTADYDLEEDLTRWVPARR